MVKAQTSMDKVVVTADGEGVVSHAGSALLVGLADTVGLTGALSEAMAGTRQRVRASDFLCKRVRLSLQDSSRVVQPGPVQISLSGSRSPKWIRSAISAALQLTRIDWATIGRVIERVGDELLDGDRLSDLFEISIDEVSWRKQHRYLTLVSDHRRGCVVWGIPGAGQAAADAFFDELGPARSGEVKAISMDMGPGYAKSARQHAPQATLCIDNFHVAALATKALDEVRRDYWNQLRGLGDQQAAKRFKDARWALLKNPENLTDKQAVTHRELRRAGGAVWRGYLLKEAVRGIFAPGLTVEDVDALLDRLLSRLARSRLKPFIRLGRTIRKHRDGILAAIRLGLTNARHEALNNKVRLITRRAYGFHSAHAALALVYLCCGPITLRPPHELHALSR